MQFESHYDIPQGDLLLYVVIELGAYLLHEQSYVAKVYVLVRLCLIGSSRVSQIAAL